MQSKHGASTTLTHLQAQTLHFAEERDWLQFHTPKNLSMSIAIEAAELMEHFQWDLGDLSRTKDIDEKTLTGVREELADIAIYCLQLANVTGIDLAEAVLGKLEINAAKYPVNESRGHSEKYTELRP